MITLELSTLNDEQIHELIEIASYNVYEDPEINQLKPEYEVDGFECDDLEIIEIAENFVKKFSCVFLENGIGLYIFGRSGTGKTYLAKLIYKLMSYSNIHSKTYILCEDAVKNFDENPKFRQLVESVELLVLDNLTIPKTSYQRAKLEALINARYATKLPTIITTTMHRAELETSDPELVNMFDKLIEMTHGVQVKHAPRRKEIARQRKEALNKLLRIS